MIRYRGPHSAHHIIRIVFLCVSVFANATGSDIGTTIIATDAIVLVWTHVHARNITQPLQRRTRLLPRAGIILITKTKRMAKLVA